MKNTLTHKACVTTLLASSLIFCAQGDANAAGTAVTADKQAQQSGTITIDNHVVQISGHIGVGHLNGNATEIVYNTNGTKLSELTWSMDDIYMLNIGGSITPTHWLKINADFWFKLNDGSGNMNDYDWLVSGFSDWTHWSHHEDVPLDKGTMFDINAEIPFYSHQETTFTAIVGYKRENWGWKAYGGDYIYSTTTLRDTKGSFPDGQLGISYEQWWDVPYIGIGFTSHLNNWDLAGRLIGSTLVDSKDEDTHHLRNLLFEENFGSSSMFGVDFTATYNITPQLGITGALKYFAYDEATGSTTITNLQTGQKTFVGGDSAGADNHATIVSLLLNYQM